MTLHGELQHFSSVTHWQNFHKVRYVEVPCRTITYHIIGALLQRFPVAKVLGGNIFLWGITTIALVGVKNTAGLITLRTLLGIFEAVINPALIMLTSAWYQKDEAAPRFGLWYCGLGLGQILGGLISFAAQHATSTRLEGWRIMFMCIGIFNVLIATVIFFWLPSTPEDANFLCNREKEFIAERLARDCAGNGVKKLRTRSILEVAGDAQTWLLCLLVILIVIPSGVITTYSSVLIKDFGYTPKQAALLNMPSGVVSIFMLITSTWVITKGYKRCASIMACQCVTLLGGCLMSFSPRSNHSALLAGIYLVNAVSFSPHLLVDI
jgi:MFS family permease